MSKNIGYSTKIEEQIRLCYYRLNEKNRRYYTYTESMKLGHGGKKYIGSGIKTSKNEVYFDRMSFNKDLYANVDKIKILSTFFC